MALPLGDVSGTQLRDAISARSNFGLGFALTHTLIKSDESHRKSTNLSHYRFICISLLKMNIELIILNYLGYDSNKYLSFLIFYIFSVLIRGLPILIVYLAGVVDAGRSLKNPGNDNPRIKEIEKEEGR